MEVIKQILEFLNSSFVSTISGVIIGGYITIKINTLSERKRILMEFKINIWDSLDKTLFEVKELIGEMEKRLNEFSYRGGNYFEVIGMLDVRLQEIKLKIKSVQDELNRNTLIVFSKKDLTKQFDDESDNLSDIISIELCNFQNIDINIIENSFENWKNSFVNLNKELQGHLLKDVFNRRDIKKIYK